MSACITASTDNMELLACHHELLMVFQLNVHNYCMQLKKILSGLNEYTLNCMHSYHCIVDEMNTYIYTIEPWAFGLKSHCKNLKLKSLKFMYLKTLIIFTVCVCAYVRACMCVCACEQCMIFDIKFFTHNILQQKYSTEILKVTCEH